MGLFHDKLAAVQASLIDGADADLNTIMAELTTAYDEDFSGATAHTAELTEQLTAKDAVIADLKARNYDLLMSVTNTGEDDGDGDGDGDDDGDDEDITPDDLFGDDTNK